MDPYIHTLIATGLLGLFYFVGRMSGAKEGRMEIMLVLMEYLNVSGISIDEEGDITLKHYDGTEEKL